MNSSPRYHLRKAAAADAVVIVSWFSTFEEAVLWGGPEVPRRFDSDWLAQEFEDTKRDYLVLVDDTNRICATYALRRFDEEHRLHIGRFAVSPDLRGKGIGSSMLEMATDRALKSGADKLTLYVYDANPHARRLYERFGFHDTDAVVQAGTDRMVLMAFTIKS